jgi:hypothetical protein
VTLSLATGSGTARAALSERGDDLYETPPSAVHALLAVEPVPLTVWEPACGPGAIVSILRASGRAVVATDLVDYGCPDSEARIDFLMESKAPDGVPAIVTNPPFKLAEEFLGKAIELVPEVHFLLRLAFLEGMRWQKKGFAKHLARVWVFAPRLPMMHRHKFEGQRTNNSGMPFAWFVFHRDAAKDQAAQVRWINPRDYENTQ